MPSNRVWMRYSSAVVASALFALPACALPVDEDPSLPAAPASATPVSPGNARSLLPANAAAALPGAHKLAARLAPNLLKPLPDIKAVTGVDMPAFGPLLVVATLGDDGAAPDLDRGFAVAHVLMDLLYYADPGVDVLVPWYYQYDVLGTNVPVGFHRDSAANAYRVAARDHARWCASGSITGTVPARIDWVVDACAAGKDAHRRQWTVRTDADWPAVLAQMCEFALATATAPQPAQEHASCARAKAFRPASIVALARYGGPVQRHGMAALEALLASDPAFSPAALEYLGEFEMDDRDAFWNKLGEVATRVHPSSATQLMAYNRALRTFGWRITVDSYAHFFVWLRDHAQSRAAWMTLAFALAQASPQDNPDPAVPPPPPPPRGPGMRPPALYLPPNEVTHSASLAVAFALYAALPDDYRAWWIMGRALEGYGSMERGRDSAVYVPAAAMRNFDAMLYWANHFNAAALEANGGVAPLWDNRMRTVVLTGGTWQPVFDHAAEVGPRYRPLYEDAMNFALPQWGGTAQLRSHVQQTAIHNNPGAEWATTLEQRWRPGFR